MIQSERIRYLNQKETKRIGYVMYWMQQSQRVDCNHALEFAIREGNTLKLPVVAVFGLTRRFPEAQLRHYAFLLEGIREVDSALADRGIRLVVRLAPPPDAVDALAGGAAEIVTDSGYLRIQRRWRARVAKTAPCRVIQVESDVVVPVETASDKEEYAARTIRPKIEGQLSRFLKDVEATDLERDSLDMRLATMDVSDVEETLSRLALPRRAKPVETWKGGESHARSRLSEFLKSGLSRYHETRSDPGTGVESGLSPYLHFGQLSPLRVALAVGSARGVTRKAKEAFMEELVVRRELAVNMCHYNDEYDTFAVVPDWARKTLEKHAGDARERVYAYSKLDKGETHDPYWNAAQREMVLTGKMHGYMRMYWGKRIIEWSRTPEEAFSTAVKLNNTYELDGRDPNSFAGVAWCFGKHDRPWKERPVFGKVRWMSPDGLRRKFHMDDYVERVRSLEAEDGE
jgi:deoxyribodipyrimidine photo-lyase